MGFQRSDWRALEASQKRYFLIDELVANVRVWGLSAPDWLREVAPPTSASGWGSSSAASSASGWGSSFREVRLEGFGGFSKALLFS